MTPALRSRLATLSLSALLVSLAGCSGGGGSSTPPAPPPGQLSVKLVDGPDLSLKEIKVHILRVEIQGPDGWATLGTPDRVIDLLTLTGGVVETLVPAKALTEGTYSQLRLVLGSGSTVTFQDGSTRALDVPSGLQSGIKLVGSFKVEPGTTRDLYIDFDAAHSVQVHSTGNGKVILRPVVRVIDKLASGSLAGTLRDSQGPVAGALVMAELQETGGPRVVRTTRTATDGSWTLDLLPLGFAYTVVSQPATATAAWQAVALEGQEITTAVPTRTGVALTVQPAAGTGEVTGTCTPVPGAEASDTVDLLQTLAGKSWVVRSLPGVVGTTSSSALFLRVPAGTYGARAFRTTLAPDGSSTTLKVQAAAPVVLASGGTATVTLAF